MTKAIHISPVFNRKSIAESGLIPTKVKLPHHLESFKKDEICTKDGKALYTWIDCEKNEKFIRDMIFCHLYIDPRNKLYEPPDAEAIDFRTLVNVNMAPWDYMVYDVYEVSPSGWPSTTYYHSQEPTASINNTIHGMPEEYAHNDKILAVFNKPLKKIKIVGQAEYYYDNNKYHIKVLR